MDPFYGEIRPFAFTFAPQNWAYCMGQSMYIQQFQTLYAVIGTAFGGDGVSTFKVPDLQGRMPIHRDGIDYNVGNMDGVPTVTITAAQTVPHTHNLQGTSANGLQFVPGGGTTPPTASLLGVAFGGAGSPALKTKPTYADPGTLTAMSPNAVSAFGGGANGAVSAHDNNQPSLVLNFCICTTDGEFPSRS